LRKTAETDSKFKFAGNFIYEQCQKNNKKLDLKAECVTSSQINQEMKLSPNHILGEVDNPKTHMDILDDVLEMKPAQSAGIQYCEKLLEKGPGFEGLNIFGFGKMDKVNKRGVHASIVVGRRKKNGKCQYLIRNSYGEGRGYHKAWDCEKGQVWVNREDLERNLMEVTFIHKK
jgi:hypothetical protein